MEEVEEIVNEALGKPARVLEEALLSVLLVKPVLLADVSLQLRKEMFETPEAAFIYGALIEQYNRGEVPDFITTEAQMRRRDSDLTNRMGGIEWLGKSLVQIRHSGNVLLYAAEIKRQYQLRSLRKVFYALYEEAGMPETDPQELIAKTDDCMMRIREEGCMFESMRSFDELMAEAIENHRQNRDKGSEGTRILTGMREFDAITGGLLPAELHVVAGRPASGKTAFSLDIAIRAAREGHKVCIFNMEMKNVQMMNRILAGHAGVPPAKLRASCLTDEELAKMDQFRKEWKELPLYLDYRPNQTVEDIRSAVLMQKKRTGCDVAIIDYLHLVNAIPFSGETTANTVGRTVRTIKRLAAEADCCILLLSQMNRDIEKRGDKIVMPKLSDLRDSGVIEQDADMVYFVHHPTKYGLMYDPENGMSLIDTCYIVFGKNRHGGDGIARVKHNDSLTRFY